MKQARNDRAQRDVSGILLLDKPQGLSSNQALQRAKRLFGARKAGHTGSLDPLATGLLPICFGEATKIAGYLLGSDKAYEAQLRFGITTATDDSEGEILEMRPVADLDRGTIETALAGLRGRITQLPPIYSAIKQGGLPLYKRARRGESVAAPLREVDVQRLDVIDFREDRLSFVVECGSGTYVRSLARDLGERLGCGAHLTALRRLWIDPFRNPAMVTLAQLEALSDSGGSAALDALLLPIDRALDALPRLQLSPEQAEQLRHGQRFAQAEVTSPSLCRAIGPDGGLIALVDVAEGGEVRVRRGFAVSA